MSTTTKKISKKDCYAAIADVLNAAETAGIEVTDVTYAELQDFVDHEVQLLESKAAKAKDRAAEKRAEGDALREAIYALLTDEFQTIPDLTAQLGDPDVSPAMVTSRLTQLCSPDVNMAEKSTVTVAPATEGGKSKKASAYRRI